MEHGKARLTPVGRLLLTRRIAEERWPVALVVAIRPFGAIVGR